MSIQVPGGGGDDSCVDRSLPNAQSEQSAARRSRIVPRLANEDKSQEHRATVVIDELLAVEHRSGRPLVSEARGLAIGQGTSSRQPSEDELWRRRYGTGRDLGSTKAVNIAPSGVHHAGQGRAPPTPPRRQIHADGLGGERENGLGGGCMHHVPLRSATGPGRTATTARLSLAVGTAQALELAAALE